ncbi:MAG TPA: hypothetical protein VK845_11890 [Gemmatimonadales bacterium]|nr:hypothetical protein [Gemmatimonadales bacterium]
MRTTALSLALVAFLAVGCGEPTAAPTGPADGAPAYSIDDAPPGSGIVIRTERGVFPGWTDWDEGIFVFIGIDPRDFCNGVYDYDIIPMQEVNLPDDRGTLVLLQGEDLRTTVWPFPGFTGCQLLDIYDPLATGVSDLVYTENRGYGAGRSNANAFGYRAHGTLRLANGADAAFSAHWNRTYNGNTGIKDNSQISLN